MRCDNMSNLSTFFRAVLGCGAYLPMGALSSATYYLPRLVCLALAFIGSATFEVSSIYADDIPVRAWAPDAGMPPSPESLSLPSSQTEEVDTEEEFASSSLRPYTDPGNLRFRATPLRQPLRSSETESSTESSMKGEANFDATAAVQAATNGDESEWQVEHNNPLRKGNAPRKGLIPPTLSKPPTEAKLPVVTEKPSAATSGAKDKKPWTDVELVVPTRPGEASSVAMNAEEDQTEEGHTDDGKAEDGQTNDGQTNDDPTEEKSQPAGTEVEDAVLHLRDEDAKPAPLPPGMTQQSTSKSRPEKGFDPEDNDQPAQRNSKSSLAESPEGNAKSSDDANEPQSSELLKLLQENPAIESSNAGNSKSNNTPISNTPKMNGKNSGVAKPESSGAKPVVESPAKQPIKVLPQTARMRPRIDTALNYYLLKPESNVERSPWAVFHAILPFGSETTLRADGRTVSAINWMCFNGSCRGQRIFIPQKNGSFQPAVGAGVQGHDGQFLAILAQSRVPANYPLQVGRKRYTLEDLIDYEMRTCQAKTELTFKLIALSHYLVNDATWVNDKGEPWSIERLVEEELAQPIIGSACGGTHRLMGLSFALKQRRAAGLPIDGQYARAEIFLKDFIDYAWTLQNPDGSFSTEWFEGRGNKQDMQRKLQTTGHIVEWLVYTLPDEELQSPRLLRSIEFLTYCLVEQRQTDWKIGPRSHALHALAMYQERIFGVTMGTRRNLAISASRNQRR
jgi:hypothetical protein